MKKHLAIIKKEAAMAIFAGKKTIETRFSKHKISPFGQIFIDDIVYVKLPGGDVVGKFRVKKVYSYQGLISTDIDRLFDQYGHYINCGDVSIDSAYQKEKRDCKYATLLFLGEVEQLITSPIKFKKSDMRGWVVLD